MIGERRLRRTALAAAAIAAFCLPLSCQKKSGGSARVWRMGEQVKVGPLIYSVLEAEWHADLKAGDKQVIPQNRFLLVRLSVTNSGGQPVSVPGVTLEGEKGEAYYEQTEVEGVPDRLPPLRHLAPAETIEGRVLFDAPQNAYRLRVREEGEPDQPEDKLAAALIEIPLNLPSPLSIPVKQ